MFSSTNVFQNISCPNGERCSLTKCIFKHAPSQRNLPKASPAKSTEQASTSPHGESHKISHVKRRKLEKGDKARDIQPADNAIKHADSPFMGELSKAPEKKGPGASTALWDLVRDESKAMETASSPISPRPGVSKTAVKTGPKEPVAEALYPRTVKGDSAGYENRRRFLKLLHGEMKRLNEDARKHGNAKVKKWGLDDQALIKLALDEEEMVLKDAGSMYPNKIKHAFARYKKMKPLEWITLRQGTASAEEKEKQTDSDRPKKTVDLETGLSLAQDMILVNRLVADTDGMVAHGYITAPPTADEIAAAQKGVEAAAGYEQCDRCNTRFQVFPDRRADGALTSGSICTYHWGRRQFQRKEKTDNIKGSEEPRYTCCNEIIGTKGCTTASTHVFKVSDAKRLASILPFERTPANPDARPDMAITFDCEMGYTTYGLELIRLTAVTWPHNEVVIDVLVRPLGQVLDLNTRFSGITPDHFVGAKELDISTWVKESSAPDRSQKERGSKKPAGKLQIASSPAVARTLITSLISPETPLIGHSVDNDLNVIRLVHPTVIDTVILLPHPGGLPFRLGLRSLVSQYLQREIQQGGDAGHDSLEDASATGDLVRWKVKKEWEKLKSEGWTVRDGKFVAPLVNGSLEGAELVPLPKYKQSVPEQGSKKRRRSGVGQTDGGDDAAPHEGSSAPEMLD